MPRHQSGYWQASTLMISAPRSPRWRAAVGPAQPIVRSMMRTPASGKRPGRGTPMGGRSGAARTRPPRPRPPAARCRRRGAASASGAAAGPGASNAASPIRTGTKAPRSRWTVCSSSSAIVGHDRQRQLVFQSQLKPFRRGAGFPDGLEQRVDLVRMCQAVGVDRVARVPASSGIPSMAQMPRHWPA